MPDAKATARASELLRLLVKHITESNVTDIHLHSQGPVFYRAAGKLKRADGWGIFDANGYLTIGDFNALADVMLGSKQTRVFTFTSGSAGESDSRVQCRIQRTRFNEEDVLILRAQPKSPPSIQDFVPARILNNLANAQGLVLVVGPVGGGKTTAAAGIARYWANLGRHILTMEDPVEYQMSGDKSLNGIISHQAVALTPNSDGMPLDQAIFTAFRSDLDGVFIGEVRTQEALRAALEFSRCSEPVVSTYHSASIGDALASLYQVSGLPWEVAKMTLGNALQSVLYVGLAFTAASKPVPVVMYLPMQDPLLRKSLSQGEQHRLPYLIEEFCSGARTVEGAINRREAVATAAAAGATTDSIQRALRHSSSASVAGHS